MFLEIFNEQAARFPIDGTTIGNCNDNVDVNFLNYIARTDSSGRAGDRTEFRLTGGAKWINCNQERLSVDDTVLTPISYDDIASAKIRPAANKSAVGDVDRVEVLVTDITQEGVQTQKADFSFNITSVNDAPVISSLPQQRSKMENCNTFLFGPNIAISDSDVGDTETLTVTLAEPQKGALCGIGSYDAVHGIYTYSGTVEDVQNALWGILFKPHLTNLAYGQTETNRLSVVVRDANGAASATQNMTITLTSSQMPPQNETPPEVAVSAIDYSGDQLGKTMDMPVGVSDVRAGAGDDILRGNLGDNRLDGGAGNNQLWGGLGGNDLLIGGLGKSGYWAGCGDGHEMIRQGSGGGDALYMYNVGYGKHTGMRVMDDLYIALKDGSTIDVLNWYSSDTKKRLQGFVFDNQTAYAWNDGKGALVDLADPSYSQVGIKSAAAADSGECILRGSGGGDTIQGGSGTCLTWGREGDDLLIGGSGSNAYFTGLGNGSDRIVQNTANLGDALCLYNVGYGQQKGSREGNDLAVGFADGSSVSLADWYSLPQDKRVQGFVFDDHAVYGWNDGKNGSISLSDDCYVETEVHKAVVVDNVGFTMNGTDGCDMFVGGSGNDTISGGQGSDILSGGGGNDLYIYAFGDGHDFISADAVNNEDSVSFNGTVTPSEISAQIVGDDLQLHFMGSTDDTLVLQGWARGGGYQLNHFIFGGASYHLSFDGKSWLADK